MNLLELFPQATEEEISETKSSLTEYRRIRKIVQELESIPHRTPQQEMKYKYAKGFSARLERAVSLIQDDEARRIVEARYINGEPYKIVVGRFSAMMHPDTVNEKLKKGIVTVANTLKDIS